ncbi:hypothetical protein KI387_030815, partial [Taxus chinensis]
APLTGIKKEKNNGFRYSSAETTINNLVHLGSDLSVTANGKPEVASVNFHVTEIQRGHTKSISYGSKDEAYFDSVACWESDCDDDFLSVNGDFLLSAGNTMSIPSSGQVTPRPSIASLKDTMMLVENKDIAILVDNKDRVIPVENKDIAIPVENKDRSIPAENKDIVIPVENKNRLIPVENKDIMILVENKDGIIPVEKKKKLKEFFMEKLSSEDITASVDHVTSSDPQLNWGAGAEDDGTGTTVVKDEGLKCPGGNHDTVKDVLGKSEGTDEHDLHEKQMVTCCLPRLVQNGTVNGEKKIAKPKSHFQRK